MSKYNHKEIEKKIYDLWIKEKLFHSEIENGKKPFVILMPPPNVTGILHMGHILNNTIQDVLWRYHKLKGENACWIPGLDHAAIATENKVTKELLTQGIFKNSLSREDFLAHVWAWTDKYGDTILKQLKSLGAACDWERKSFTMDDSMSSQVIETFVDLYNAGYIYKGVRIVNWDPLAQTALSDEEVIYEPTLSKLYYIKYKLKNFNKDIIVATTRPETIFGDVALCVNPHDDRYHDFIGEIALTPLVNKEIKIITDEAVDSSFGTGVLKITPAHDIVDYEIGERYSLVYQSVIDDYGKMNTPHLPRYHQIDRFACRELIVEDLRKVGLLLKEEEYENNIAISERTHVIIEPKLSTQWFCKMQDLAIPAIEVVRKGDIRFYPKKYENIYLSWLYNIKDWCVSRQLYWGQRIPAYYSPSNRIYVAKNIEEAFVLAQKEENLISIDDLKQDEDVLDTWFSSWLWPMSVYKNTGERNNEEFNYYNPCSVLVTAPDIIFFWVARMIMITLYYKKQIPFKSVYFTGIVRDKKRRKMSKSLGNSPDPLMLIDKYGADSIRVGILLNAPMGTDVVFDEGQCLLGWKFVNKVWNSKLFFDGISGSAELPQSNTSILACKLFEASLIQTKKDLNDSISSFRMSEALQIVYTFFWDVFCSFFIECIKPSKGKCIDSQTYKTAICFYKRILVMLHPFIPFISYKCYMDFSEEETDFFNTPDDDNIIDDNNFALEYFNDLMKSISIVRNIRVRSNPIAIHFRQKYESDLCFYEILSKMTKVDSVLQTEEKEQKLYARYPNLIKESHILDSVEFTTYYILREEDVKTDRAHKEKMLTHYQKEADRSLKKLTNKSFVLNAGEDIVNREKQKYEDFTQKALMLKEELSK